MVLNYDYAQPVKDMVAPHLIAVPYKLMEYMDLLNFPVHHKLTTVTGFGNNFHYINYSQLGNGLVSAYDAEAPYARKYYTGWQCTNMMMHPDAVSRQKNDLKSPEDFKRLYPQQ